MCAGEPRRFRLGNRGRDGPSAKLYATKGPVTARMKLTKKKVLIGLTSAAIAAVVVYSIWEGIANPPADLTKLLPAFTTASAEIRDHAAKAVSAVKAKDYATAVEALGAIVNTGTLSEGHKQGKRQAGCGTWEGRREMVGATG